MIVEDAEANAVVSVMDNAADRRRRSSYSDFTAEAIDVVRKLQDVKLIE